jgi:REP element-mobilizing transposase RayT
MPRALRIDVPGTIHHVMMRGLERRRIFSDDVDRHDFVSRLERVLPECGAACAAWALLPNHVHLVIRTGPVPLSRLLARINGGYASSFNRRHDRVGFLFQGRFKSRAAADDADALGLIRYVDLNPLKHGIVADLAALARHAWCSHGLLVGARGALAFERVAVLDALLGCAGSGAAERAARRARWLAAGIGAVSAPARRSATAARDTRAAHDRPQRLGDQRKTSRARASSSPSPASRGERPRLEARARIDLDALVHDACASLGVCESALCGRPRTRAISLERARIARRAVLELGASPAAVARRFGVSREAVRRAVERVRASDSGQSWSEAGPG